MNWIIRHHNLHIITIMDQYEEINQKYKVIADEVLIYAVELWDRYLDNSDEKISQNDIIHSLDVSLVIINKFTSRTNQVNISFIIIKIIEIEENSITE
jgi:hypothetical protein